MKRVKELNERIFISKKVLLGAITPDGGTIIVPFLKPEFNTT